MRILKFIKYISVLFIWFICIRVLINFYIEERIPEYVIKEYSTSENQKRINENKIAVIVIACNRDTIKRSLDSILNSQKHNESDFKLYISHGCNNETVKKICLQYTKFEYINFTFPKTKASGYEKISFHYQKVFHTFFDRFKFGRVIIIEDDLEVCKTF